MYPERELGRYAYVAQCGIDLEASIYTRDLIFTRMAAPTSLQLVQED